MNTTGKIISFKRFEIHDGDGIRTTLFFKGCPLRCKWCHNPESFSSATQILFDRAVCKDCMRCTALCDANVIRDGKHVFLREKCTLCQKCEQVCPARAFEVVGVTMTAGQITAELVKDEIFMKGSGGGVTFSGGEPLLQPDLCVAIAKLLKERNINIAVDTSGAVCREAIKQVLPYVDTFLFDIKAIDEDVHVACTGVSNRAILENIRYADQMGVPMEIRYPYVPSMNDDQAEKIAQFVKTLKHVKCIRVLPYHNYAQRKYECLDMAFLLPNVPVPSVQEISNVVEKMRMIGSAPVYGQ